MKTKDFNEDRLENWISKLNEQDSRVFLVLGVSSTGETTFLWDEAIFATPLKMAKHFEDLAKQIRLQNSNVN